MSIRSNNSAVIPAGAHRKRSGEFSGQTVPGPDAGGPVGRGSGREEGPHVRVGECGLATAAGHEDRPCEEDKHTLIPSHTTLREWKGGGERGALLKTGALDRAPFLRSQL